MLFTSLLHRMECGATRGLHYRGPSENAVIQPADLIRHVSLLAAGYPVYA